jgi:uncharacterized membrane protein YccC
MSATAERTKLLALPALPPDTIGFALRSVAAILIALYIGFWLQLESASSAAVTAGILAQPSRGMILSKAANRLGGTLIGAAVSVIMIAGFGQDRTMLLAAFAVWIGLCTAVATLLRDFRAYGAVLAGYTVGIIALLDITAPQDVFTTALARVAAITLGIVSVALVNGLLAPCGAWEDLVEQMGTLFEQVRRLAADALDGSGAATDPAASGKLGSALVVLRTPIDYAGSELQDGARRAAGARSAVAALMTMISASRAVLSNGDALQSPFGRAAAAVAGEGLRGAPEAAQQRLAALAREGPLSPAEAFLLDRMQALLIQFGFARDGRRVLEEGGYATRTVRLPQHLDTVAAILNAVRAIIAVGAAALFAVLAGWPGASFALVQMAALCALISLQPDPTQASIAMLLGFFPVILVAAACKYLILDGLSGFPILAMTMGVPLFLAAIAVKFPRSNSYGANFLTFFSVILAPTNPQTYDPVAFADDALQLVLAGAMAAAGFWLVLPVSPHRRLFRVADAVGQDLRRALRGAIPDQPSRVAARFDRLRQARAWLGRPTLSRRKLLARLLTLSELEGAVARAHAALNEAAAEGEMAAAVGGARRALASPGRNLELLEAAQALLAPMPRHPAAVRAASGLAQAAVLIEAQRPILRKAGILEAA